MMRVERLPSPQLPATPDLLVQGGDARTVLGADGRNKYGCPPYPEPELIALGSSTATAISAGGYAAAERLRNRLVHALATESAATVHARETERMRQNLADRCGLSALPGTSLLLTASGTDAHRLAARLVGNSTALPLSIIMVEPAESGSGVPAALADGQSHAVSTVPLRLADGTPRAPADIDADFARLAREAAGQGRHVLLVLCDISKTGLIAPSPACAITLQQKGNIHVLVDACQFRISPSTLRVYLEQNFMVALTGSKFLTGPSFSGALLIPGNLSLPVPAGQDGETNFGLLLRWEAALHELQTFQSLPEAQVEDFQHAFAQAVRERLAGDPAFEMLAAPALDRGSQFSAAERDREQTIFSFLLLHPQSQRLLSREETAQVYQLLQANLSSHSDYHLPELAALRCQFGQPVACGERGGVPVSALRICTSARMAADAAAQGKQFVITNMLAALDKAAMLIGRTPA